MRIAGISQCGGKMMTLVDEVIENVEVVPASRVEVQVHLLTKGGG